MFLKKSTLLVLKVQRMCPPEGWMIKGRTGKFLPIQLIYKAKIKHSLPKFRFPNFFSVTCTENHLSNTEKCTRFFEEIIFLYLDKVKIEHRYPDE